MQPKYLSLPHLAIHYDIHPDTLKKRLKEVEITEGEHYVVLNKSIRFHVDKVHEALTCRHYDCDEILNRLLV